MKPSTLLLRAAPLALLAALSFSANLAHANTSKDECSIVYPTLDKTVQINVGTHAQAGDQIGPWVDFQTVTWDCKHKGKSDNLWDTGEAKLVIDPLTRADSYADTTVDGYRIFRFHNNPGKHLGFILEVKFEMNNDTGLETTDWVPINTSPRTLLLDKGSQRYKKETFTLRATVRMRVIKTDNQLASGTYHLGKIVHLEAFTKKKKHHDQQWDTQSWYKNGLTVNIKQINAACTTPDIDVDLGELHLGTIPAVGDAGPLKDFELKFNNCPNYMNSVHYQLRHASMAAITNGILPLNTTTGASGVGVQVLESDGTTPVVFYQDRALSDYDPSKPYGTHYTVPLAARIIRTQQAVNGGTVEASMLVVATYK